MSSREEINNKDWKDLGQEEQEAARALGFTKSTWNKDGKVPAEDLDWEELTYEQQEAAKVLGYDQKSWDEGGCCKCVIS